MSVLVLVLGIVNRGVGGMHITLGVSGIGDVRRPVHAVQELDRMLRGIFGT